MVFCIVSLQLSSTMPMLSTKLFRPKPDRSNTAGSYGGARHFLDVDRGVQLPVGMCLSAWLLVESSYCKPLMSDCLAS